MSSRPARRLPALALTVLMTGGLVACGGGDSDGDAARDAAAELDAATAGATATTETGDDAGDEDGTDFSIPSAGAGAADIDVDPCTLLAEDDVATAFNASNPQWPVDDFTITTEDSLSYMPDGVACQVLWNVENSASGSFVVQLMADDDSNWELAKGVLGTPEPVDGIGDEAIVNVDNTSWARAGDLIVGIVNTNTSETSTALLERAVDNL